MAILSRSAFGGFNGKLGNVVGYRWKGTWCVRVRPVTIKNPRTEAQQRHRAKFAEEVRLAARMAWGIGVGMKAVADEQHMTVHNAFVSLNQQAFSQVEGAFEVDWSNLTLSAGPVAPVQLGEPTIDGDNILNIKFDPNPLGAKADRFDSVYLYVYSPDTELDYLAAPVYRMDKRIRVALPDGLARMGLHIYAFAVDKDGNASFSSYATTIAAESDGSADIIEPIETENPTTIVPVESTDVPDTDRGSTALMPNAQDPPIPG